MPFRMDLQRFQVKLDRRTLDVFHGTAFAAHRSITEGSPVTGAPGQPVRSGALRNSYQMAWESPLTVQIASALKYAEPIENGYWKTGPLAGVQMTLRSQVGGFHSIKLTVAGFQKLVDQVNREVPEAP
jgi:hypothetical protein